MNFQSLQKVETADKYIDIALHAAQKHAETVRENSKTENKFGKSKYVEIEKVTIINQVIAKQLGLILKSFPSVDNLPPFYLELLKITLDYGYLKKSLGSVKWVIDKVDSLSNKIIPQIKMSRSQEFIAFHRKQYYGRVCSFLKQIKKQLEYLEEARRVMKQFPAIKTSLPTVCIAGFPNVGKSTLLGKLTPAKPEIKDYSFTTKSLNIGYMEYGVKKIQVIDTPGTLNRKEKMNAIEMQAYLAMELCADCIVYVYDLTERYPLDKQELLFQRVVELNKVVYIYLSKTDILPLEKVKAFQKKGYKIYTNKEDLEEELIKYISSTKELQKRSYGD